MLLELTAVLEDKSAHLRVKVLNLITSDFRKAFRTGKFIHTLTFITARPLQIVFHINKKIAVPKFYHAASWRVRGPDR